MNKRLIVYYLGRIMMLAALLFVPPVAVSIIYRDGCVLSLILPALGMLVTAVVFTRFKPKEKRVYAREGFVIVTVMWILFSLFGALPFYLSREIPSFIDAFFETVSGFTTTGASILTNVEAMSPSLLFWRSWTHWVGGMGVLALAIAILPGNSDGEEEGNGAIHILKAETPGPTFGKLVTKLRRNVRILYLIYAGMTVIEIILLLAGGMSLFDSIVHSFGTAGTGGFGIKNASIGYYDSAYIDWVIGIFMLLFGINFNIYYFLLTGKLIKILQSEELRWYLGIVAASVIGVTVNILPRYESAFDALRYAFFQVSSIVTTTGYATADFGVWPTFSQVILVILMFIGACASSTGGGLKVSRVIILIKTAFREIRHQINPREVRAVRCDNTPVSTTVAYGVTSYFAIYMLLLLGSVLCISLDGLDFTSSFTAVVSCINNIGPGLGAVGPTGNFAHFSVFSKLILSLDMLAGRLELYPLLIALSPSTWKKNV